MTDVSFANPLRDDTLSVKVEARPPAPERKTFIAGFDYSGTSGDGRLRSAADSYATALAGGGAVDQVNTSDYYVYVGQNKAVTSPLYRLHQAFVRITLRDQTISPGIPADATIVGARLISRPRTKATQDSEFTLEAYAYDWGDTLDASDWRTPAQLAALPKVAEKPTSALLLEHDFVWDDVALVAAVQAALATGKLRLVVVSSRQRASTAPLGNEYLALYSQEGSNAELTGWITGPGWETQLEVTWRPAHTPAEVELAGAPPTALKISNAGPGGFGGASFRLPAESGLAVPYHALVAKGNLLTVTHGDPPVSLHEGEITGDVDHAAAEGGKGAYEVASGGLWWRAAQRRDFACVLTDDDIGQWSALPLAAQGYTLDLDGHVYVAIEANQAVEANKEVGAYYWLSEGLGDPEVFIREIFAVVRWSAPTSGGATYATIDYSRTTPFGVGVYSPWINLRTWANVAGDPTTGIAVRVDLEHLRATALRIGLTCPAGTTGFSVPRIFEVLDPCVVVAPLPILVVDRITATSPGVLRTVAEHGLTDGDRVFIYGTDSNPKLDGWRTVTVVSATEFSVGVNVSATGSTGVVRRGLRVDEALAEVAGSPLSACTRDLAEAVDAEPMGGTHWSFAVRPHASRADGLNQFAMLPAEPFDYGFWEGRTFAVGPREDPPPAARHYVVDPTAAGVDVRVFRATEDSPEAVKLLYSNRELNDLADSASYSKTSTPNGIVRAVYRPTELYDRAPAGLAVDVWTEFADVAMTPEEAAGLADQILAWVDENQFTGTVRLHVPHIALVGGGEVLAAHVRGGDVVDIAGWSGYTELPITSVDIDADKGTTTLGIGEERREFVARLRAPLDRAAPGTKLKPGWWK